MRESSRSMRGRRATRKKDTPVRVRWAPALKPPFRNAAQGDISGVHHLGWAVQGAGRGGGRGLVAGAVEGETRHARGQVLENSRESAPSLQHTHQGRRHRPGGRAPAEAHFARVLKRRGGKRERQARPRKEGLEKPRVAGAGTCTSLSPPNLTPSSISKKRVTYTGPLSVPITTSTRTRQSPAPPPSARRRPRPTRRRRRRRPPPPARSPPGCARGRGCSPLPTPCAWTGGGRRRCGRCRPPRTRSARRGPDRGGERRGGEGQRGRGRGGEGQR